ncbi:MAG: MarR family transcriptional regulator [Dorea sp.]|jgi:DNA-binding MarR family transcriptional regulator|nr:MarR family transcriptional regulator [Dorea sp.]
MEHNKHAARYISKLSNKLRRKIDAFSSKENFSGSQGRVLHFILAQNKDIFQKDIEEEYSLRPPTATELLKKMEQNGLIHREVMANDARMKRIIVSDKALQYKDMVIADITLLEDELTKGISKSDLDIFFKVIEKMLSNIS